LKWMPEVAAAHYSFISATLHGTGLASILMYRLTFCEPLIRLSHT
jgi:hypothetical protein